LGEKEEMEIRNILNYLGVLLEINGVLLLLPLIVAVGCGESLWPYVVPILLSLTLGYFLRKSPGRELELGDAMLLSVITLLAISLLGAVPFFMNPLFRSHHETFFIDGFFESISGYTTTGLSVIDAAGDYPKSLLFLRSLAQWIGGVGIVVLCFSALAGGGVSTLRIYESEISSRRIHPSLTRTMKEIIKIYLFYTLIGVILLLISGEGVFAAVNQIFCAMSAGGFAYGSVGEDLVSRLVIILFMLIGAIAFPLHYMLLSGRIRVFLGNIEVRALIFILILGIPLLTAVLIQGGMGIGDAFNHSSFNLISALTTTGYSDAGLDSMNEFGLFILILAMVMGVGVGSTSGGLKLSRIVC
jgi:trk system potassium uptake protein TrkH